MYSQKIHYCPTTTHGTSKLPTFVHQGFTQTPPHCLLYHCPDCNTDQPQCILQLQQHLLSGSPSSDWELPASQSTSGSCGAGKLQCAPTLLLGSKAACQCDPAHRRAHSVHTESGTSSRSSRSTCCKGYSIFYSLLLFPTAQTDSNSLEKQLSKSWPWQSNQPGV